MRNRQLFVTALAIGLISIVPIAEAAQPPARAGMELMAAQAGPDDEPLDAVVTPTPEAQAEVPPIEPTPVPSTDTEMLDAGAADQEMLDQGQAATTDTGQPTDLTVPPIDETAPVDGSTPTDTAPTDSAWPATEEGGVFVNGGYGPGEANAADGFDSCKSKVQNGRAYVGVHCAAGKVVVGFVPPAWMTDATQTDPNANPVPEPQPTALAQGVNVEGRSRTREKTTTITRNGVSETVTDTSGDANANADGGKVNKKQKKQKASATATPASETASAQKVMSKQQERRLHRRDLQRQRQETKREACKVVRQAARDNDLTDGERSTMKAAAQAVGCRK